MIKFYLKPVLKYNTGFFIFNTLKAKVFSKNMSNYI